MRHDIDQAHNRNQAAAAFGKKSRQHLSDTLPADEPVTAIVTGTLDGAVGVAALTDRRVIFVSKTLFKTTQRDFPLSRISSIEWDTGRAQGTIRIHSGGQPAEITQVFAKDGGTFVTAVNGAI